jgi:meso-butanediol dehydrogenase / (S,S)-butanediol dehydrogenase / diacetyl reductase
VSRACLVTGGGSGIGAEVARLFAERGYRVAVNGRRQAPLDAVAAEIDGIALAGDTADPDAAQRVVAEAAARLGGLDCVVLNAGISRSGSVLDQTPESFTEVLRVNLVGAFLVARAALPLLCQRRGSVVAVASQAGLLAGPDSAAYCTSKAGLVMLIKTIAVDFAPRGVRANAVCPAWVRTPMADESMDALGAAIGLDREQAYRHANRLVPQKRPATPAEVAAVVYFLASDAASYINGVALPVDGGASIVDVGLLFADSAPAADDALPGAR